MRKKKVNFSAVHLSHMFKYLRLSISIFSFWAFCPEPVTVKLCEYSSSSSSDESSSDSLITLAYPPSAIVWRFYDWLMPPPTMEAETFEVDTL